MMARPVARAATQGVCCASTERFDQRGFTLLELMVALTVMAITMTVLLKAVSGQQEQVRYRQTVERAGHIKDAIVKLSNLDGKPMVEGFVSDLGRLPDNIHELLERGYCASDITKGQENCADWKETPVWHSETICQDGTIIDTAVLECPPASPSPYTPTSKQTKVTMNVGWNGPYVPTLHHPTHIHFDKGSDALADGFGNLGYNPPKGYPAAALKPDPRHNYGWYYSKTYKDGNNISQPGIALYSYGNGCYLDAALCKGNSAAPDLLDFTYPLSASPPNVALAYDAQGKAITPDVILNPANFSLPPPPVIGKEQWRVVIGDITDDLGSGLGVNVTMDSRPPTCTSPSVQRCLAAGLLTFPLPANLPNPPCAYAQAKGAADPSKACQDLGGAWKNNACSGPSVDLCVAAGLVQNPLPAEDKLPVPPCSFAVASTATQCAQWGGNWKPATVLLCLNIYYKEKRTDVDGGLSVVSANGSILEDGGQHTVHFVFPRTAYPGSGISVALPVGDAAFTVHESTGNCSNFFTFPKPPPPPNGTDMPTYPTAGRSAVAVKILPGQVPSFVW